jgi:hypothetical protein
MDRQRHSRLIGLAHGDYELPETRTELVRLPHGLDWSIFSGWGVRI